MRCECMQIIYHYHNVSLDYLSGLDWNTLAGWRLYLLLATGSGRPKLNWIWDTNISKNINLPISNLLTSIILSHSHTKSLQYYAKCQ